MSDSEQERRRRVNEVAHSQEMDGGKVSEASLAIAELYIKGEIDVHELGVRIRVMYGITDG